MHNITNKQYEEYQQYLYDKNHSRIITPDFVRFLVQACDYDPEAIGKQILEYYGKYQAEGYYEIRK
ncbi:MAG: hypothetical protein ACOX41_10360 [Anaerovoracaceae bacterium]|jgi:hypothetical protein